MTVEALFLIIPIVVVIIVVIILFKQLMYHLSDIILGIITYLLYISDYKKDSNDIVIFDKKWEELNPYLLWVVLVFFLMNIFFNHFLKKKKMTLDKCEKSKNDLENKIESIKKEYYKLCSDNIRVLFQDFFNSSEGNGRVSIYKHQDEKFILLGRYSTNPEYNKTGRESYPDNKGFIKLGWNNGEYSIYGIPKWTNKGREYKKFIKSICDIDDETLNGIKMKSCSFYIKRIENEDARKQLGIIVFEKLQNTEIEAQDINNRLMINKEQLSTLIKSMKTIC